MKTVVSVLVLVGLLGSTIPSAVAQGEDDLVLVGVIVADNPAESIALIRRTVAGRARPLRLGDEYGGYTLVQVTREAVLLEGVREDLRLMMGGGPSTSVARVSSPEPPEPVNASPESDWVRRAFSRAEANRRLQKEIPVILADTEVTPRVVEGEVRGLELLRLPDGTVLSQSGLLPGDVLRSLNEEPVRGLDSLWALLSGFADVDELRLVVERRGEVVRFAYDLTN